jgi:hypothetical protein
MPARPAMREFWQATAAPSSQYLALTQSAACRGQERIRGPLTHRDESLTLRQKHKKVLEEKKKD